MGVSLPGNAECWTCLTWAQKLRSTILSSLDRYSTSSSSVPTKGGAAGSNGKRVRSSASSSFDRSSRSLHPQIFRGLLTAVVNDVEINLGADKAIEARLLNSLDMYEYVLAAMSGAMKPKPLVSLNHFTVPLGHGRSPIVKKEWSRG